jgi:hypothetical protein
VVQFLALGLLLLMACATTPGQESRIHVAPGDRVRVTLANRVAIGPVQGTVASITPDTLVVAREEGGERRLSRSQVQEVEVSVSRAAEPLKAAGYGVLAAAPLVLLLFLVVPFAAGEGGTSAVLGFVLVPVAAAAAIGGAIGSGPQDAWVEANWPSQFAPALSDSFPADSH